MKQLELFKFLAEFFKEKTPYVVVCTMLTFSTVFISFKYFNQESEHLKKQAKLENILNEKLKSADASSLYRQKLTSIMVMQSDSLCEVRAEKFRKRIEILEEKLFNK